MTIPQLKTLTPLFVFSVLGCTVPAFAHGVSIQYQKTEALEIQATYEGGVPMAGAQVSVYAPGEPSTPWVAGETDEQGHFVFVPDGAQTGNWEVRVRQSGHGKIVSISTQPDLPATTDSESTSAAWSSAPSQNYTPLQKTVMAAAGVWGCVGTALFFSRRKSEFQE